jgi:hypothetical protein
MEQMSIFNAIKVVTSLRESIIFYVSLMLTNTQQLIIETQNLKSKK